MIQLLDDCVLENWISCKNVCDKRRIAKKIDETEKLDKGFQEVRTIPNEMEKK